MEVGPQVQIELGGQHLDLGVAEVEEAVAAADCHARVHALGNFEGVVLVGDYRVAGGRPTELTPHPGALPEAIGDAGGGAGVVLVELVLVLEGGQEREAVMVLVEKRDALAVGVAGEVELLGEVAGFQPEGFLRREDIYPRARFGVAGIEGEHFAVVAQRPATLALPARDSAQAQQHFGVCGLASLQVKQSFQGFGVAPLPAQHVRQTQLRFQVAGSVGQDAPVELFSLRVIAFPTFQPGHPVAGFEVARIQGGQAPEDFQRGVILLRLHQFSGAAHGLGSIRLDRLGRQAHRNQQKRKSQAEEKIKDGTARVPMPACAFSQGSPTGRCRQGHDSRVGKEAQSL